MSTVWPPLPVRGLTNPSGVWGYVHELDRATLTDLDTYAIPQAMDPDFADGFGALSVHEVALGGGFIDPDTDGAGADPGGNKYRGVEHPHRQRADVRVHG